MDRGKRFIRYVAGVLVAEWLLKVGIPLASAVLVGAVAYLLALPPWLQVAGFISALLIALWVMSVVGDALASRLRERLRVRPAGAQALREQAAALTEERDKLDGQVARLEDKLRISNGEVDRLRGETADLRRRLSAESLTARSSSNIYPKALQPAVNPDAIMDYCDGRNDLWSEGRHLMTEGAALYTSDFGATWFNEVARWLKAFEADRQRWWPDEPFEAPDFSSEPMKRISYAVDWLALHGWGCDGPPHLVPMDPASSDPAP